MFNSYSAMVVIYAFYAIASVFISIGTARATLYYSHDGQFMNKVKSLLMALVMILGTGFILMLETKLSIVYVMIYLMLATVFGLDIAHRNKIQFISKEGIFFRLRGCHPDFLAKYPQIPELLKSSLKQNRYQ